MNGVEKIVAKINGEADENAKKIIDDANAQAAQILAKAKADAQAEADAVIGRAKQRAAEHKGRIVSMADLESRKLRLSQRQQVINQCFEQALDKLADMPRDQYIDLMSELIISQIKTGGESIILSEKDKDEIGAQLIQAVNEGLRGDTDSKLKKLIDAALSRIGAAPADIAGIQLSERTHTKRGGFIMESGDVEYNNTFEALMENSREELVPQVASALFK